MRRRDTFAMMQHALGYVLLGMTLWTRAVLAEPPSEPTPLLSLTVETPEGGACLLPSVLAARVEAELGRSVFTRLGDPPPLHHMLVRVVPWRSSGFEAELTLTDRTGQVVGHRWLRRPQSACDTLNDALVLVVSTLAGSQAMERAEAMPVPTEPREPSRTPKRVEQPIAPASAKRARLSATRPLRQPWRARAALSGVMATGLLPGRAFGVSANVWAGPRDWMLGAGAVVYPAAYADLSQGAEARLSTLLAQLLLCGDVADLPRGYVSVCAAASAGGQWAATTGLGDSGRTRAPAVQAAFGLRAALATWQRGAPYIALWAHLPVVSTRFLFEDSDEPQRVYHVTQAGLTLEIGIFLGRRS